MNSAKLKSIFKQYLGREVRVTLNTVSSGYVQGHTYTSCDSVRGKLLKVTPDFVELENKYKFSVDIPTGKWTDYWIGCPSKEILKSKRRLISMSSVRDVMQLEEE